MTSSITNNPASFPIPSFDRMLKVAGHQDRWTDNELRAKRTQPDWTILQAQACLTLAMLEQSPAGIAERLQQAAEEVALLPHAEISDAARTYLRTLLPESLQTQFDEIAVAAQATAKRRQETDHEGRQNVSSMPLPETARSVAPSVSSGDTRTSPDSPLAARDAVPRLPRRWLLMTLLGTIAAAILLAVLYGVKPWWDADHPQVLAPIKVYPRPRAGTVGPEDLEAADLIAGRRYLAVIPSTVSRDNVVVFQISLSDLEARSFDARGECLITSEDIHGYVYFVMIATDQDHSIDKWFGNEERQSLLRDDLQALAAEDDESCQQAMSRVLRSLTENGHKVKAISVMRMPTAKS